ncbi:EthD family reductase [Bacillus timonensis]|nr:EthD family reductase [Bacillus timonensis]
MMKVVALYKHPENKEEFDQHYFSVHAPLTKKIPGLLDMKLTRFTGSPMGESPYYMMCEMIYENKETFKTAMKSEEAKASGKDAMQFAGKLVTIIIGEDVNE